jgi:WD40 repeat protein
MVTGGMDWDICVWSLNTAAIMKEKNRGELTKSLTNISINELNSLNQANYTLMYKLQGHSGWVTCLALNLQGNVLFSGSDDNEILCWDLEEKEVILCLDYHIAKINALKLYEKRQLLISGDESGVLIIYDLDNEQVRWRYDQGTIIEDMSPIFMGDVERNALLLKYCDAKRKDTIFQNRDFFNSRGKLS